MNNFGVQKYIDTFISYVNKMYKGDYLVELKLIVSCKIRFKTVYKKKSDRFFVDNSKIIYVADEYYSLGGLADRLSGIISLFDYCMKNGRDFGIYFVYPFNLQEFLIPNKYDWNISKISRNSLVTKPIIIEEPRIDNVINAMKFKENMFSKYLKYKKKQLHCYTNAECFHSSSTFSKHFNTLFKPSNLLEDQLRFHQNIIGHDYISISFRFVKLLGDFNDCINITLSDTLQEELIEKCIIAIKDIYKNNNQKKILVTSDSLKFLSRLNVLKFVYVIPGEIKHINYNNSNVDFMKTFIDFMMISRAQKAYLARTNFMYKSGFAKKAAMVNNITFHEYIIQ